MSLKEKQIMVAVATKCQGDWQEIYKTVKGKNWPPNLQVVDDIYSKVDAICQANNIKAVWVGEPDYPETLKNSLKPPFVIFYKGDISLINKEVPNTVWVTGGVDTLSDFGKRAIAKVVLDINEIDGLTLLGDDQNVVDIAAQKAIRLIPNVTTKPKTAMMVSTALDNITTHKVLIDNILLSGGVVFSVVPPGCTNTISQPEVLAELSGGNIVVTEIGARDAIDFVSKNGFGYGSIPSPYGYAVVHDITEARVDGCNRLVQLGMFNPYVGEPKFHVEVPGGSGNAGGTNN